MKELPDYQVVQLKYIYPDDTMNAVIQRLNDQMREQGWQRGVGVITSYDGECLYIVYEKDAIHDNTEGESAPQKGGL